VNLEKVPWAVPLNIRFDVSALPDVFSQQSWKTKYLWFDLFCIPQDGSKLANVEISRQADIFRNSTTSVAWLSDVESWDAVSNVVTWLALSYLRSASAPGLYETQSSLDEAFEAADRPIEFYFEYTDPQNQSSHYSRFGGLDRKFRQWTHGNKITSSTGHKWFSGWFSSLWTLQEACLCPDLTLFSRSWEPLKDMAGSPITLDSLFQLVENAQAHLQYATLPSPNFDKPFGYMARRHTHLISRSTKKQTAGWPLGAWQLNKLAIETKVYTIRNCSPIDVLVLGNLRQCTESRAQAIMSVLGATTWFTRHLEQTGTSPPENRLILGMYPHEFVLEVAQKFGGSFYCIAKSTPTTFRFLTAAVTSQSIGSMLPFSTPEFRPSVLAMRSTRGDEEDHPALQSWAIQPNGSIRMTQAGIVGSSWGADAGAIQASIIITHGKSSSFEHVELREWLRQRSRSYHWYAVALCRDRHTLSGIILKGARFRFSSRLHLIRTGYFSTLQTEFPMSQKVDWLVL
jgi:hypothetical protein